jgi:hypothetical protein
MQAYDHLAGAMTSALHLRFFDLYGTTHATSHQILMQYANLLSAATVDKTVDCRWMIGAWRGNPSIAR